MEYISEKGGKAPEAERPVDLSRVDIRVGKIVNIEPVSEKLMLDAMLLFVFCLVFPRFKNSTDMSTNHSNVYLASNVNFILPVPPYSPLCVCDISFLRSRSDIPPQSLASC